MAYIINGREFERQSDIVDHIRSIANKYEVGTAFAQEDFLFMLEVLSRHPRSESKIGIGVASMHIKVDRAFGGHNRQFWLVRTDGTETDFSWQKCLRLKPVTDKAKVMEAFRAVVASIVAQYKRTYFSVNGDGNGRIRCQKSGEMIAFDEAQVDHVVPFQILVEQWMESKGLTYAEIELVGKGDGQYVKVFRDTWLAAEWQKWHTTHAKLRIIKRSENAKSRPTQTDLFGGCK